MEAAISGIPITPSVLHVQEKIESTAERSMLSGALAKQRVYDLSIAEAEREKRKDKDNSKIVQKYGEIYVYQGRADIEADNKDKEEVVNMRNARLGRAWRDTYKKIMKTFPQDYWDIKELMRVRDQIGRAHV